MKLCNEMYNGHIRSCTLYHGKLHSCCLARCQETAVIAWKASYIRYLQGKVVFVLVLGVLRQPKRHSRQHDGHILAHVGVTVVIIDFAKFVEDIFQDKNSL